MKKCKKCEKEKMIGNLKVILTKMVITVHVESVVNVLTKGDDNKIQLIDNIIYHTNTV